MAQPVPQQACTLLQLPPELRNIIYREAVLQQTKINIHSTATAPPSEPGLLSTCRQIRSECTPIYLQENRFCFVMHNFDTSAMHKWCAKRFIHKEMRLWTKPLHITNPDEAWSNLLGWIRKTLFGRVIRHSPSMRVYGGKKKHRLVAGMMMALALKLTEVDGLQWPRIEEILNAAKDMIATAGPWWI